ncbi:MAG TPA: hypothetical protein VMA75_00205 [Candidatus Paceibacterota bacterium]|nr:hypothetical protein [Candidatus Paceibacterota bacterium]
MAMSPNEPKETVRSKEVRYLKKIALFCIPFAVLLGLPILALYGSGEYTPWNTLAARMQSAQPVLVGLAFSNPVYYLDLQNTLAKKPQVIVLGSSRAGQFSSHFFNASTSAYVDGGMMQEMSHFQEFLNDIPTSSSPQIMIMVLDQKFFDPNYNVFLYGPDNIQPLLEQSSSPILGNLWAQLFQVYDYYFTGKINPSSFFNPSTSIIGLNASVHDAGFENDGSYLYGNAPASDGAIYGIENNTKGFEYSATISQTDLQELNAFLAECQARHIYVVGVIPPLSPLVYNTVLSMGDKYGYLNYLTPDAGAIFSKYGFGFYNFTDPQSLGITTGNGDMWDNIHMTQQGWLKAFITMASTNQTLKEHSNLAELQQELNMMESSSTSAQ